MKKNIISMLAAVAVVAAVFTGCKKGEEDPGLSLSSRKSRVAGEWTLSSTTISETQTNTPVGGTVTKAETTGGYDAASGMEITTTKYTPTAPDDKDTSKYTMKYTFEKDGTFTSVKNESTKDALTGKPATLVTTTTGTWDFNKGVGELKKGEVLYMKELTEKTDYTPEGAGTVTVERTYDMSIESAWVLVRLAKDEIKAYSTSNSKTKTATYTTDVVGRTDIVLTAE